jgi:hypothetical protein
MSFDFEDDYENNHIIYIRKNVQSCSDFGTFSNNTDKPEFTRAFGQIQERMSLDQHGIGTNSMFRRGHTWKDEMLGHFAKIHYSTDIDTEFSYDNPAAKKGEDDPEKSKSSDNTDTTNTTIEDWQAEDPSTTQITSNKSELNNDSFTNLRKPPSRKRCAAIANIINNLFENPEGHMKPSQRIAIFIFTAFEAYRTLISSFLIVFVPQNCGGYSCTIMQNLIPKDNLEKVAISVNAFMALYFCGLFATERIREDIIKKFLIPDKTKSTDKEYLIQMLCKMRPYEQKTILSVTRLYRRFAQFLLLLFFVNASISCIVIRKNFLNNTTIIVFITNTFFMINRIYKTLKITSSGEYNIYSAYRTDSLLYNRYRGGILGGITELD